MPGSTAGWTFEGLCEDPIRVADQIFEKCYEENAETWRPNVFAALQALVSSEECWQKLPLLSIQTDDSWKGKQVVRFQGMIQDMREPEMFSGTYDVRDLKTGDVTVKMGLFHDSYKTGKSEEVEVDDDEIPFSLMERRVFYCVSVPGESDWVTKILQDEARCSSSRFDQRNETGTENKKPRLEDDDGMSNPKGPSFIPCAADAPMDERFFNCYEEEERELRSVGVLLKAYDSEPTFLLNEVYEFVGLLCMEAAVSEGSDEEAEEAGMQIPEQEPEPQTLVPCLHMIAYKKIRHDSAFLKLPAMDAQERCVAREELKRMLVDLFNGDELVAEYLLLHLISQVFSRGDSFPCVTGNTALNLLVGPKRSHEEFMALLLIVMKCLLPKNFCLDLSLEKLNTLVFAPKKDYDRNCLTTGILQLSEGTHLVVDELLLSPGELNEQGLSNVNALKDLIKRQKVEYQFAYNKMDFNADIPCLVLSEGKSLLQCELSLPIVTEFESDGASESRARVYTQLDDPAFMTRMRGFLAHSREQVDYTLSERMRSKIIEEFAQTRATGSDQEKMTHEELSMALAFARQMSLTYARTELDEEIWAKTREMEMDRKARLRNLA